MIDVNSPQNKTRTKNLQSTYVRAPEFGLVLGAGVTAQSGVPTYHELALRLLELAADGHKLSVSADWVRAFIRRQRELVAQGDRVTVSPEEVVLMVSHHLEGDEASLRRLVKTALYEHAPAGRTVGKGAFSDNPTLDSVLSFCAARPDTVLAPQVATPAAKPRKRYDVEANIKVGGILTTNYDNLVEGAFHTKYRRNLLKPVGRPSSRESDRDRRLIPVYHIHGYVGYREQPDDYAQDQTRGIVIAEDDYFRAFYDPLGFGTYVAMDFLRRYPCLFIGSSLTDQNLRRFLFHLSHDSGGPTRHQGRFAVLKTSGIPEEELTDAVLLSYGVETIWIDDFDEIGDLLRGMYLAVDGVEKEDWDYVADFAWS